MSFSYRFRPRVNDNDDLTGSALLVVSYCGFHRVCLFFDILQDWKGWFSFPVF